MDPAGGYGPPAAMDPAGGYGPPPSYANNMGPAPAFDPASPTDIGPFARPILNKLVRVVSAVTSFIALILHFAILGQGLINAMKPTNSADSRSAGVGNGVEANDEERTTTSSRRRTSSSISATRSPPTTRTSEQTTSTTEQLLGRALPTTGTITINFAISSPTIVPKPHLTNRRILQIRQNRATAAEGGNDPDTTANPSNPPTIFAYVPNTDIPTRNGAIGFTASSHILAAFIILLLFWWEWLLFMKKPTLFGYWGPLIIAGIQFIMAFDILGRSIPVAVQAGAYILLLMAVLNMSFGGWIVLRARKKNAPPHAPPPPPPPFADQSFPPGPAPQEMYNDPYLPQNHMAYPPPPPLGPDPNAPPPAPIQEGSIPTGDPNAMPYMGGESHNTNQGLSQNPELTPFPPEEEHQDIQQDMSPRRERSHSKSRRRRASTGTRFEEDIDSYYSRSPTLRSRRHSYAGGGQSGLGYVLPPPAHPADDVPATSPISLWGPEEYRRRLEYQRRSRRRSLVQPSMQFDPHTGRYVEPAGRFVQRSSQVLPNLEEEEDEEAIGIRPLSLADPTLRQDGFANRTMVWKRLRRNSGIY